MQVCTSLQTDNHANTSLLSFLQAGCPSCRPTNSVKALKARALKAMNFTQQSNWYINSKEYPSNANDVVQHYILISRLLKTTCRNCIHLTIANKMHTEVIS